MRGINTLCGFLDQPHSVAMLPAFQEEKEIWGTFLLDTERMLAWLEMLLYL